VTQPGLTTCSSEVKVDHSVSPYEGRIVTPTFRLSTIVLGNPIVELVPQSCRRCTLALMAAASMAVAQCQGKPNWAVLT
jgi:hypothetical protein